MQAKRQEEEAMLPRPPVRTLADMTPDEIAALEAQYKCKVVPDGR